MEKVEVLLTNKSMTECLRNPRCAAICVRTSLETSSFGHLIGETGCGGGVVTCLGDHIFTEQRKLVNEHGKWRTKDSGNIVLFHPPAARCKLLLKAI